MSMATVDKFFPFKIHLHIFQLEEYKPIRLIKWVAKNFFVRSYAEKKPLVWTFKAKFIFWGGLLYWILLTGILSFVWGLPGFVIGVTAGTQTYFFLILGLLTLRPREIVNRILVRQKIRRKITQLKETGLQVIGITGSYGKTSIKDFLYQFLSYSYETLKTPESYNTLFGILKVVDLELDGSYKYFICEMGAYKIGEIKELSETLLPDHGILAGINEQHLEKFGRIENTIKAKFELIDSIPKEGTVLVNGASKLVEKNYSKYRKSALVYSKQGSDFYIKDVRTTREGSTFTMVLQNEEIFAQTPLVGGSNLENIVAAASMAYSLGMSISSIAAILKKLKPVPHRLEISTSKTGLIIIDDAYSSNVTGFKAALNLLDSFNGKQKVIATPGIVELGAKTTKIHKQLGSLANEVCNQIFLVGESERTKALAAGANNPNKVRFINSLKEINKLIEIPEKTVLLIENDLTENY